MAASNKSVIVAMVPYPAFTHINPLFLVARLITSHNISVHFICLPEFNQDLESCLKGDQIFDAAKNIHFNDILLEYCESTKDENDRVSSIHELLEKHSEPIRRTCLQLSASAKKLVIIYDSIMKNYMGDVHSLSNVETCIYHTGSAFNRYSLLRQSIHDELDNDDDHEKLLEEMQDEFPTMDSCNPPGIDIFVRDLHKWNLNSGGFMISSREVEGKYIDLLAHAKNKPLWALGPLYMLLQSHNNSSTISSGDKAPRHECLEFLDNQDVNSVIYVSFGTTPKLSQEQVNELAFGLEKSNQRFIWVLGKGDHDYNTNNKKGVEKFEKKFGKIELPQGFEERVKGRGMAVRSWVPQLKILGHSSTGGFLSHCGWKSCIESISMGVPIITWPKEWDQPYNAVLVTNVLKIAIPLCSWTRRDELVTPASIEKSVKILMDTAKGEEMRKRAVELSNKIKRSVSPGGVTTKELESFISYITK